MTKCIDYFFFGFPTYCTSTNLRTCLCTRWLNFYFALIPCMLCKWYCFLLCTENFITYTATYYQIIRAFLYTGCFHSIFFHRFGFCMACCFDFFCFRFLAGGTGISFYTCFCTAWSFCLFSIIPCMLCYLKFLCFRFLTNRTGISFDTCFCTAWLLCYCTFTPVMCMNSDIINCRITS